MKFPIQFLNNNQLCIIGTSHLFKDSIHSIKEIFMDYKPDLLLLELDQSRYNQILSIIESGAVKIEENITKKDIKSIEKLLSDLREDDENNWKVNNSQSNDSSTININNSDSNLGRKEISAKLLGQIRKYQWSLGRNEQILPGLEFITGIVLARLNRTPINLIDISIEDISAKLSLIDKSKLESFLNENLSDHELRNVKNLRKEYRNVIKHIQDPIFIQSLISNVEKEYPEVFGVIISDRNKNMAESIVNIIKCNPNKKILTIIGLGHMHGIYEILQHNMNL